MRRQDILNREPPRPLLTNVEFPLGQRSIKMRYVAKESKNAITRLWIQKNIFRISPRRQCKKEANIPRSFWEDCKIGRSEKPKSWKSKNGQADYLPRHSLDARTVFEI